MAEDNKLSFLDLSKNKIKSVHQLESALLKVADLKLRSEKLKEEDIIVHPPRRNRNSSPEFPFLDPIPVSMRNVNIQELCQVDIEWKMLTLCRPANKFEEDIFTRYVELAKLTRKVHQSCGHSSSRHSPWNVKTYGRSRVPDDWGDESIGDNAHEFCYDYFVRQPVAEDDDAVEEDQSLDRRSEETTAETSVRRRPPVKKGAASKKLEAMPRKSNRLSVPETPISSSPCSTPETKVRGQRTRSITPVPRGGDKSVKKKHKNSVKKKSSKKKAGEETKKRDSS